MPVHSYTLRRGTTGQTILVFAREAGTSQARIGLRGDDPAANAAYVRAGESAAQEIRLRPGEVGTWTPGGLIEVDRDSAPGIYEVGVPDEMLAEGARRAVLMIRFPGAMIEPIHVELVGFDAQDGFRLGMNSLSLEMRVHTLRTGFPHVARRELQLAEDPLHGAADRVVDPTAG